jgi:hypothetical protein
VTRLRRLDDRGSIPAQSTHFPVRHRCVGPSYTMDTWDPFRRGKGRDVKLTTHSHVMPVLRMRGAIPPVHNYPLSFASPCVNSVIPYCSVSSVDSLLSWFSVHFNKDTHLVPHIHFLFVQYDFLFNHLK